MSRDAAPTGFGTSWVEIKGPGGPGSFFGYSVARRIVSAMLRSARL
jgi:hypothetical protein